MADAKVVSWIEAGRLPDGRTGYRLTVVTPKPIDTGAAFTAVVGTCATCRFMRPPASPVQYATCGAHDDTEPNARFGPTSPADSEIWVTPDFGCVQWEPKA